MSEYDKTQKIPMRGGKVWTPDGPTPTPETLPSGQHKDYWVLSETERAKGFVRPVRDKYVHVGALGPNHPLIDLTDDEKERYKRFGYIKFEKYNDGAVTGRYWTQEQLDKVGKGCGVATHMGLALAETYARDPKFYGATFCCGCGRHLPVAEFVWDGTQDRVGS